MPKVTRAQFFARAAALGIEIDEDRDVEGVAFMANAPAGYRFEASTAHCCALGGADPGERVDYGRMLADLELIPCTDPKCEYCNPDEDPD
jgi:hypothetical protein